MHINIIFSTGAEVHLVILHKECPVFIWCFWGVHLNNSYII